MAVVNLDIYIVYLRDNSHLIAWTFLIIYAATSILQMVLNLVEYNRNLSQVPINPALKTTLFGYFQPALMPRVLAFTRLGEAANSMSEEERGGCPKGVTKWYMIPFYPVVILSEKNATKVRAL